MSADLVGRASAGQDRAPTLEELREFLSDHTQQEAAEHYGISRQKVQRILKAEADRGATLRVVDDLIEELGELDAARQVQAEVLRSLAVIVDRGARSATGAGMAASVQASVQLRLTLAEFADLGASEEAWLIGVFAPAGDFGALS